MDVTNRGTLVGSLAEKTSTFALLAIIPANYPEREVALTSRIANTLLLATKNQMAHLSPQAIRLARQTITLPNHKTQASLQIARQFWPSSHQVIGAWVDDSIVGWIKYPPFLLRTISLE